MSEEKSPKQVVEDFKKKVIEEYKAEQAEKLRERMSRMGKSRSAKKRAASKRTIKIARAARHDPRKRKNRK